MIKQSIPVIFTGLLLGACSSKKEAASYPLPSPEVHNMVKGGEEIKAMPGATIFKMSGDYADNVAITLNEDGSIAYYPDPADITDHTAPFLLGNGWYLNRQGLSPNSVFTSYTFDEYKALKRPPSHKELLDAIIPDARVTEFRELPVSFSEALARPEICIQYIK